VRYIIIAKCYHKKKAGKEQDVKNIVMQRLKEVLETLWHWIKILSVHLMSVFNLSAFLPFSKLAHPVCRTVAMTYAEYAGRK